MYIKDRTIYVNRGDAGEINFSVPTSDTTNYEFQAGDKIQFRIFNKGDYSTPIKEIEVAVNSTCESVDIPLSSTDTTIGEVINKEKIYWYEISLNEDNTAVGYDRDDGPAELILLPGYVKEGE